MPKRLSPQDSAKLANELDSIRAATLNDLGARDARHIHGVIKVQRYLNLIGRFLLWFGFIPPIFLITWPIGVVCLALAKILENMEIGHNVMHGQYDWMNDPALNSQTYDWDTVSDAEGWRYSHNYEHHTYTNIVGKDRDVGYGILRISADQPWQPKFFFQPITNFIVAAIFDMGVGIHGLEIESAKKGHRPWSHIRSNLKRLLRKVMRLWGKDYVLFPLLSLLLAPISFMAIIGCLAGNFLANLLRNFWTNIIIFCGHFPGDTQTFLYDESVLENETRGEWYIRQLNGSANIKGKRLFHILSGHLSHQIEHHLFPDIPAHRYPDIAPQVQKICQRYGQQYVTGGLTRQYTSVLGKIFKYALPIGQPKTAS